MTLTSQERLSSGFPMYVESGARLLSAIRGMRVEWLGEYWDIVQDLLVQAPDLPGVRAVWLHGSRAVGSHHDASDLDLTFIVNTAADRFDLSRTLAKVYDYKPRFVNYFDLAPMPFWSVAAGEIGVHIIENAGVNGRLAALRVSVDGLEDHQAFAQHTIVGGVALFDPARLLDDAQHKCASIPPNLFTGVAYKYLRLLEQKVTWWAIRPRWKNDFERLSDVAVVVEEIARCHYPLNQRLFMPGMKEYDRDLRTLQPDIGGEVRQLIELSPQTSQTGTRNLATEMIAALRQRFQQNTQG